MESAANLDVDSMDRWSAGKGSCRAGLASKMQSVEVNHMTSETSQCWPARKVQSVDVDKLKSAVGRVDRGRLPIEKIEKIQINI